MESASGLFDLSAEVVLLLGCTGPIGRQFAAVFAETGCALILGDINEAEGLALSDELSARNKRIGFTRLDVTKEDDLKEAAERIEARHGRLSVLVNNFSARPAGFYKRFEESDLSCWQRVMDVNLSAIYLSTREFSRMMMRQRHGSIINVSSIHGVIAPDQRLYSDSGLNSPAVYAASKSGVIGLTRYLAAYLGGYNIRVNCICPGGVNPGDVNGTFVANYSSKIPLGRMADMEDMKGPVVFLASNASRYVTGHTLIVDGGQSIW